MFEETPTSESDRHGQIEEVQNRIQREHGLDDKELLNVLAAVSARRIFDSDSEEYMEAMSQVATDPRLSDAVHDFELYMQDVDKTSE